MKYHDKEIEWNLNKDYGSIISSQINNLKEAARMGEVLEWYNEINVLYMLISGHKKMEDQEVQKIMAKITKIGETLNLMAAHKFVDQEKKVRMHTIKSQLFQASTELLKMMHSAGLWFEHIEKEDISKAIYKT